MNLINNIYFISSFCRRILHFIDYFSDVVYTVVRCRIHLDDIHRCLTTYLFTHLTFAAWTSIYRMLTIYRFCQYLCYCRFTCTSRTTKQIRMSDTVSSYLIFQCRYYMFLSLYLVKFTGTKFSV